MHNRSNLFLLLKVNKLFTRQFEPHHASTKIWNLTQKTIEFLVCKSTLIHNSYNNVALTFNNGENQILATQLYGRVKNYGNNYGNNMVQTRYFTLPRKHKPPNLSQRSP